MSDHLAPIPWLDVVLLLALIALNGVLAMSELAIVSSREARLRAMARSGSRGAQCALDLAAEPGRFLSTVQSGITLIAIFAGAFSGEALGEPTAERMELLFGLDAKTAHTVGIAVVIVLTTYVSLVIGEIVPKQIALRSPEPLAVAMSRPMHLLSRITAPFVWLLDRSSLLIFKLVGLDREIQEPCHGRGAAPRGCRGADCGRSRGKRTGDHLGHCAPCRPPCARGDDA